MEVDSEWDVKPGTVLSSKRDNDTVIYVNVWVVENVGAE